MSHPTIEGFRLSPQQRRLWQLHPQAARFRVLGAMQIEGPLDATVLKAALGATVRQHEILRTSFQQLPALRLPLQVVADQGLWVHAERDLRAAPSQQHAVDELWRELAEAPLDPAAGPLLRTVLVTRAAADHLLLVCGSALCLDGPSLGLLNQAIAAHYAAQRGGARSEADGPQYADVSEWLNEVLGEASAETPPWLRWAADAPALLGQRTPFASPHSADTGWSYGVVRRTLGPALSHQLDGTAQRHGLSAHTWLLACWAALLRRQTGQPELLIAAALDGRNYDELAPAIGPLARDIPLHLAVDDGAPLLALARQAQAALEAAAACQETFSWEAIRPAHTQETPWAPFHFAYAELPPPVAAGEVGFALVRQQVFAERWSLRLACLRQRDGFAVDLCYDTDTIAERDAARLADQLEALLASTLAESGRPVAQAALLPSGAGARPATAFETAPAPIHVQFAEQARRVPGRTAVRCGDVALSYRELDARANQLAHALQRAGVGPEAVVAIALERSAGVLVALLAALKAGGAYLLLDPHAPREHLAAMLEEARAHILLTQQHLAPQLPPHPRTLCLDTEAIAQQPDGALPDTVLGLAYVLFTSGSTGRPKGVMVEHAQLACYTAAVTEQLAPHDGASFALVSTFTADLGNTMIFPALCSGGTLHVITQEQASAPDAFADYCTQHAIDYLKIVPSHLAALLAAKRPADVLPRRMLVLGGEATHWDLVARIKALAPECGLLNHYGPTETTVGALTYHAPAGEHDPRVQLLPLGWPLRGATVTVVDELLRPLPAWVAGEAVIGGAGVARGYIGRPDLTAERFVPDPLSGTPGARMYRTGDRVRTLPDDSIEFLGRLDDQAKIRGYRIEPSGVAAVLRQHTGVRDAAVVVHTDERAGPQLVAYVVPEAAPEATAAGSAYVLPNGLPIAQINKHETDFFYEQIFVGRTEFQHGIVLQDHAVIVDVGANIGLFSLFVQQVCPTATVYAFEPLPPICAVLQANAAPYSERVRVFGCGLSDRSGEIPFLYYPQSSCQSGSYADVDEDMRTLRGVLENNTLLEQQGDARAVLIDEIIQERSHHELFRCPITTLSAIIDEQDIARIDLLKIDVEKSELDILRGIREEHWPRIAQIVIEAHDVDGQLGRLQDLLQQRGYAVTVEQSRFIQGTNLANVYARRLDPPPARSGPDRAHDPLPPVAAPRPTADGLAAFLAARLPDYMVPAHVVLLDELPLTPNGKLDRPRLPLPAQAQTAFVAPQSDIEALLCAIWARVLKIDEVGTHSNFFALGGDSIQVILVVALAQQHGLHLSADQIFAHPTIAALAPLVEQTPRTVAEQGPVTGEVPLTPIQHWFFDQNLADAHHWNQSLLLELRQPLDPALLAQALAHVQTQHDALRLRFRRTETGWHQEHAADASIPLSHVDLSDVPDETLDTAIAEAAGTIQASLRLDTGPLVHAALFDLGRTRPGRLLLVAHHLLVDGVSWFLLLQDLEQAYGQLQRGESVQLPPKTTSFKQWAEWLHSYPAREELAGEAAFWRRQADPARLPCDLHEGPTTEASARVVTVALDAMQTEALLRQVPPVYNTQLMDVLLAALAQTWSSWHGGALYLDLENHGREALDTDGDISRTVGWFATIFPVVLRDVAADPGAALRSVKEQLRALPSGIGYGLLRYLSPDPDTRAALAHQPPAEVRLTYLGQIDQLVHSDGAFGLAREPMGPAYSPQAERRYLLDITAVIQEGALELNWIYSAARFHAATVEALAQSYRAQLEALIAHCLSPDTGGYTASDFPRVKLTQDELDALLGEIDMPGDDL
ncbi:MAG TPA: amino acid adenylation domain-containing protein [Roseiflexaceae bacterium]|nr:amino acid adenylation domain-containing protein [Roseiflexaceae bacterium]